MKKNYISKIFFWLFIVGLILLIFGCDSGYYAPMPNYPSFYPQQPYPQIQYPRLPSDNFWQEQYYMNQMLK